MYYIERFMFRIGDLILIGQVTFRTSLKIAQEHLKLTWVMLISIPAHNKTLCGQLALQDRSSSTSNSSVHDFILIS